MARLRNVSTAERWHRRPTMLLTEIDEDMNCLAVEAGAIAVERDKNRINDCPLTRREVSITHMLIKPITRTMTPDHRAMRKATIAGVFRPFHILYSCGC
jgi:hypothetical protein